MGDVAPFGFALLIRDLDEVLVDDLGHGDFLAALSALGFHADASDLDSWHSDSPSQ